MSKVSKRYLKVQASGGGGQTDRQTKRQTDRYINTMTRPGLGAGPSENIKLINKEGIIKLDILSFLY